MNRTHFWSFQFLSILFVANMACARSDRAVVSLPSREDPVRSDPLPGLIPPAGMEELSIVSHGDRMNGLIYSAGGTAPNPVVMFLHGYPGNERNLDLAQVVRRAGHHALYIDYRGAWGSGGTFSFANSLEDVAAILAWVRSPENVAKYHFDAARIALVGHSSGGWLALLTGGHESPEVCVAALAAWNAGWAAKRFAAHADERKEYSDFFIQTTDVGGPMRATATALMNEVTVHASDWDYLEQTSALKNHSVLLVAGTRDSADSGIDRHKDLANSIRRAGGNSVQVVTFEDDHSFSSNRVALADTLVNWLRNDCARSQTKGRSSKN